MQTLPSPARAAGRPRLVDRGVALVLLLAVAAVLFAVVSTRPMTKSESRYVEAGAEMVAGGDWVVPHLSYVPYFEKPILTYWLEAVSQLAFGASAVAVRLPSIFACLGTLGVTYAFGRHLRGPAFGLGAAALLLAGGMFEVMGSVITTDPLFSALLVAAWYAFWRHDRAPRSAWIWAFWAALGLAVLTKGPLGVALVGSTVGAYLVLDGRPRDLLAIRPVRGALVIVGINLPWSVLVWQRDPRFLGFFYVRQNVTALVDSTINHAGPPWFYLPILVGAFFPFAVLGTCAVGTELWTTFSRVVRGALARGGARTRPDAARLYLACMALPPLLLLSASASKLGTYIVPLLPAAALLVANHFADRLAAPTQAMRWTTVAQVALLAAVLPFAAGRLDDDSLALVHRAAWTVGAMGAALVVPMLAGGLWMARGRIVAGMSVVAAGGCVFVVALSALASDLGGDRMAGSLVAKMVLLRRAGEPVVVAGPIVDDYTIVRMLGERVHVWGKARELGMGHFTEVTSSDVPVPDRPYDVAASGKVAVPRNRWLLDNRALRKAWTGSGRVWFVGRVEDVDKLRSMGLEIHVLAEKDEVAVATSRPLPAARSWPRPVPPSR